MVEVILKGFITGIFLSLGLGTVFFALIQNSIRRGFLTGVFIASGVIISDMLFITIALVGTSFIDSAFLKSPWLRVAAILLLLGLGLFSLLHNKPRETNVQWGLTSGFLFFSKGFLLNALNPANLFAWAALCTYAQGELEYTINQCVVYFSCALLAIFGTEVAIAYGAYRVKHRVSDKVMRWINRVAGIIYIGVAIGLLVNMSFKAY